MKRLALAVVLVITASACTPKAEDKAHASNQRELNRVSALAAANPQVVDIVDNELRKEASATVEFNEAISDQISNYDQFMEDLAHAQALEYIAAVEEAERQAAIAAQRAAEEEQRRKERVAAQAAQSSAPAPAPSNNTTYSGGGGSCGGWENLVIAHFGSTQPGCRVLMCESRGNPNAVNSSSGASGLFQVMPSWASRYQQVTGVPYYDGRFNPNANAAFAAYLVRDSGWASQFACY